MLSYTDAVKLRRQAVVDKDGSPEFAESFGVLANDSVTFREIRQQFPAARKYEPMDSLVITNNSDEDFSLSINGNFYAIIPAKTIPTIKKAIWNFQLTNLSSTESTAANEVSYLIQRSAIDADKRARM